MNDNGSGGNRGKRAENQRQLWRIRYFRLVVIRPGSQLQRVMLQRFFLIAYKSLLNNANLLIFSRHKISSYILRIVARNIFPEDKSANLWPSESSRYSFKNFYLLLQMLGYFTLQTSTPGTQRQNFTVRLLTDHDRNLQSTSLLFLYIFRKLSCNFIDDQLEIEFTLFND